MKALVLLVSILFLYLPFNVSAQDDCAVKLRQAQEVFNSGQIERVPGLLISCIESGFTREEQLIAYKLLINAYIFDDNISLADNTMKEFLKKFPDYRPTSADPALFVSLMEEFDNNPRYNLGISGGTNISDIRLIESHGVHDLNSVNGSFSPGGFGFQAGLIVSKFFGERLEIGIEPKFLQMRYEYKMYPFPFAFVEYFETQNNLLLPLSISWLITSGGIDPYLKAGAAARYLLSAKANVNRSYENTGNIFFNDLQSPETNISHRRKELNYSLNLGAGVKYKIPKGYFFFELSYNHSPLNDVVDASRNPALDDHSLVYFYVDNDFHANFISLSMGFNYSFYNPKKLKVR